MNEFDVYNENCPARKMLEIISDKWTVLIVDKLAQRTCRFGELRREIGGISQKMLSQTLRMLERNGFVARHVYPVLPLKVEYSLTELGMELSVVVRSMADWAEQNMKKIMDAQNHYQELHHFEEKNA